MRTQSLALTAAALTVLGSLAATSAEARPSFAGNRVGGSATAERPAEALSLLDAMVVLFRIGASAKATPVAVSEAPASAAPAIEECEDDKKRAEAARAAETRRTASAEKSRVRGGEPLYLAF